MLDPAQLLATFRAIDARLEILEKTEVPTVGGGGGAIGGTIAAGQVAYGTAADTIGGDAGFTYVAATDSVTAGDYFTTDGGQFGISGNELLTVDAAGLFKFTGIDGITVEDDDYIGVASDVRIKFDSSAGYLDAILGDAAGSDEFRVVDSGGTAVATVDSDGWGYFAGNVGIGTPAPGTKLEVWSRILARDDNDAPRIGTYYETNVNTTMIGRIDFEAENSAGTRIAYGSLRGIILDNTAGAQDGQFIIYTYVNGAFTPVLYVDRYVGISTSTPAARLDIDAGEMRFAEMTAPSAPAANSVVIYAEDNGAGKTRLMALFSSGAAQQIAIQP